MTRKRLYHDVGGLATLQRVHKIFYDKIYAHDWLKDFFKNHDQALIERQQSAFMSGVMGGPDVYVGKPPKYTHQHMYITAALFEVRQGLLRDALVEAGVSAAHTEQWLKLDGAFKKVIVNHSLQAFHEIYTHKQRIIVDPPPGVRISRELNINHQGDVEK
ncbi:MAG: group 1 truncated hemoglobin [Gammaproteobacteria bacterium]|nr:group 1 truncated hemoglobin [Gammaproteobacteria bacterium]